VILWTLGLLAALFLTAWALLVPLLYSTFRALDRRRICAACGSSAVVPIDSPVGRTFTGKSPPG
jgi:hypothetical protein